MNATETVVNDLNTAKLMLCNPQMLTPEMCVRIGQAINSAIDLLKEQTFISRSSGILTIAVINIACIAVRK